MTRAATSGGGGTTEAAEALTDLIESIAEALNDVYKPAGVLMFWSSRVTYLDGKRPCDLWSDRDIEGLRTLANHVHALADGAFS